MAAVYANKFTVEITGPVTRVVCADERGKIAGALPPAIATVGEFVMTNENAVELAKLVLALHQAHGTKP